MVTVSCFDAFADNLGRRLLALCTRRAWRERVAQWQDAYNKHGTGSTFVRARIIGDEIYEPAAPVPDVISFLIIVEDPFLELKSLRFSVTDFFPEMSTVSARKFNELS
ncbi:MAG: hypothetical protein JO251_16650 [Verrucomicrobia bacterium]|nr:hypothetical protein [Verrucomicrobiota bacterium]